MKNRIKLFIIISTLSLLFDMKANAQIFDGITQPTKFRVWVPVSIDLHNSKNVGVAPFVGYKQDIGERFSITPVLQYDINKEAFVPQVWLNFNVAKKFYVLSRSIYDTDMFRSSKQDNKFDLEKGKDYKQMFIDAMKKAAQNPDDYPGYEVAKKVYARCTEATTVKTYQKMYQVLLAGDPKRRSYRVLVGDLYRDIQNRDKNKKYGRT